MFVISMKYPALIIMFLSVLLINTLVKLYLNKKDFYLLFINLIIVYNIFKRCLTKVIKSNEQKEKLKGIMSFFNPFNKRSCNDGILCSFMAFIFYFFVYVIFSIYKQVDKYGFSSPQGTLNFVTIIFVLLMIFLFYNAFKRLNQN